MPNSFAPFNLDEKQKTIFDFVYNTGYNSLFVKPDRGKVQTIVSSASSLKTAMEDIINDSLADPAWSIEDLETIVEGLDSLLSVLNSYSTHLTDLTQNFFPIMGVSTMEVRVRVTYNTSIDGEQSLIDALKSFDVDGWLTERLIDIQDNLTIISDRFNTGPGVFQYLAELINITTPRQDISSQQTSEENYLGILLDIQQDSSLGEAIESSRILSYTYTIDSLNKSTDRRDFLLSISSNQLLEIL